MRRRTRTRKLTILLLKQTVESFNDALRNPDSVIRVPLKNGIPYEGEFCYSVRKSDAPGWQNFIEIVLKSPLTDLSTSSVSAVLFVKAGGRIFAFTFGYGRNLLKSDCYELGFGLKTVLNRIDPERLRSLDLRTYEDMVVSTRKQTSRSAEMAVFGLDVSRDLLRAVTGEPEDPSFAKRLTGADALVLSVAISPDKLGEKCEQILQAYQDNRYQKYFDWVDHLKEVRDSHLVSILNEKLEKALKTGGTEKLHLAPPEVINWQSVEKFRINGTRNKEYIDLDINEYLNALGDKKEQLTVQKLKNYRVSVCYAGSEQFWDSWSLFNCIVWETSYKGKLYTLLEGKWFEIAENFAKRVNEFVKSIPISSKQLPEARSKEKENAYNERIAQEDDSLICLDLFKVKPVDATSLIEFCDLLSIQKQFIHVKKRTRSATLSHLFAQGTISARVFLNDGSVRKDIRNQLINMAGGDRFVNLIPDEKMRPNPTDYEIVYAIITKSTTDWPPSLPFFSQLNLMQNARMLQALGYKVTIQYIKEMEVDGEAS